VLLLLVTVAAAVAASWPQLLVGLKTIMGLLLAAVAHQAPCLHVVWCLWCIPLRLAVTAACMKHARSVRCARARGQWSGRPACVAGVLELHADVRTGDSGCSKHVPATVTCIRPNQATAGATVAVYGPQHTPLAPSETWASIITMLAVAWVAHVLSAGLMCVSVSALLLDHAQLCVQRVWHQASAWLVHHHHQQQLSCSCDARSHRD
jgi:hypothetical protein